MRAEIAPQPSCSSPLPLAFRGSAGGKLLQFSMRRKKKLYPGISVKTPRPGQSGFLASSPAMLLFQFQAATWALVLLEKLLLCRAALWNCVFPPSRAVWDLDTEVFFGHTAVKPLPGTLLRLPEAGRIKLCCRIPLSPKLSWGLGEREFLCQRGDSS